MVKLEGIRFFIKVIPSLGRSLFVGMIKAGSERVSMFPWVFNSSEVPYYTICYSIYIHVCQDTWRSDMVVRVPLGW